MVLNLRADKRGLRFYNKASDPMPIQGLDMSKGIEFYCKEHVPNVYKIYTDGDVIEVMGYSGLGDLYNEAMKTIYEEEIARGYDIQDPNHITSNKEFHRMLVEQLNKDNIAKVEREQSLRTVSDIEEQPLVKSMQRVITTINFCARVDLEDASIYIGEGYENLAQTFKGFRGYTTNLVDGVVKNTFKKIEGEKYSPFSDIRNIDLKLGESIYINVSYKNKGTKPYKMMWSEGTGSVNSISKLITLVENTTYIQLLSGSIPTDNDVFADCLVTLTKTSTPKPFVKSHMPSGKLAFITNATSETHSFVGKGIFYPANESTGTFYKCSVITGDNTEYVKPINKEQQNMLVSKTYSNCKIANNGKSKNLLSFAGVNYSYDTQSFSQLLIYKGNLTQEELEGELAKEEEKNWLLPQMHTEV